MIQRGSVSLGSRWVPRVLVGSHWVSGSRTEGPVAQVLVGARRVSEGVGCGSEPETSAVSAPECMGARHAVA